MIKCEPEAYDMITCLSQGTFSVPADCRNSRQPYRASDSNYWRADKGI